MKKFPQKDILVAFSATLLIVIAFGFYQYLDIKRENDELRAQVMKLEDILGVTEQEKTSLSEELTAEKEKVGDLVEQVEDIAGTVGVLDKLSKTDEELLQKYSKVYFLNEHYVPSKLTDIPKAYVYNESVTQYIHGDVWRYLEDMLEEAEEDGITLWINSAYRSFTTQASLKSRYTVIYGSGANAFSADQGYSEHQLGTTVDFTTQGLGGGVDGFSNTESYQWLLGNAHRFGFTLSYPEGNAYYIFEPWHWRFVGRDLAGDLHRDGKHFYDLDQREIDEYLVKIYD